MKSNKVVVPPMKITDVPAADPAHGAEYRAYKMQFQAPQNVGLFTWKVFIVSDTFVGDEAVHDITLKIDDPSVLAADDAANANAEDEISDPEEDSLAGQMALMRGGSVKKRPEDEESDDESSTDEEDEKGDDDDSSSDSD